MRPKILQLTEGYILTNWNSLESVLRLSKKFRGTFRVFQIVSFQLKYVSNILQFIKGYILTIWNSLESVLKLSKKFRGTFRVFQIVYY